MHESWEPSVKRRMPLEGGAGSARGERRKHKFTTAPSPRFVAAQEGSGLSEGPDPRLSCQALWSAAPTRQATSSAVAMVCNVV